MTVHPPHEVVGMPGLKITPTKVKTTSITETIP
jgi:hypothetical protein